MAPLAYHQNVVQSTQLLNETTVQQDFKKVLTSKTCLIINTFIYFLPCDNRAINLSKLDETTITFVKLTQVNILGS